jgi:hypothetical protein
MKCSILQAESLKIAPKSLDLLPPDQQPVGRNVTVLSSIVRRIAGRMISLMIKNMYGRKIYIEPIILKRIVTFGEGLFQVDSNIEGE